MTGGSAPCRLLPTPQGLCALPLFCSLGPTWVCLPGESRLDVPLARVGWACHWRQPADWLPRLLGPRHTVPATLVATLVIHVIGNSVPSSILSSPMMPFPHGHPQLFLRALALPTSVVQGRAWGLAEGKAVRQAAVSPRYGRQGPSGGTGGVLSCRPELSGAGDLAAVREARCASGCGGIPGGGHEGPGERPGSH